MLPVIAIIGRPNVGKSTLFNCLTKTRDALVADLPGLTRDRQYGQGKLGPCPYIVIDTGGLAEDEHDITNLMAKQVQQAIQEADCILFVVDGKSGLTGADETIAQYLREQGKLTQLVVNKTDNVDPDMATAEFHRFGLGEPVPISASHNRNVVALITNVLEKIKPAPVTEDIVNDLTAGTKIAIVGRPNVGKSTLVNRLLGEERVIVFDAPGTTRDSIYIPLERFEKPYTIIDTAGIRRQRSISDVIEKFSVIKTLQAIEQANVVIFLVDARQSISEQDLHLLGFIIDAGKAVVIAINKWDGLSIEQRDIVKKDIDRRLNFMNFAEILFISALHGTGVGNLYDAVDKAYASATQKLSTPKLTRILDAAIAQHQPPLVHGRRIKLRYAHPGGYNPPIIVIHGNQASSVPDAYHRYLINFFRQKLRLIGTPIRIEFKESDNPYEGRKNQLTERQIKKKQRLMRYTKKR